MRAVSSSANVSSRSKRAVSGERPFFSGMMILVQISASVSGVTVVCMAISETGCQDHGTIKLSNMGRAIDTVEAVALYASASEFESPDLTPEGVPPKAADFSCFLPGKNFFFHDFSPTAPTLRGFVA